MSFYRQLLLINLKQLLLLVHILSFYFNVYLTAKLIAKFYQK